MNARCLRFVLRKSSFARLTPYSFRCYSTESTTTAGGDNAKVVKESKPLRILFCGSDEFSIMSLNLLCEERERNPELIESIDVLVRPAKPVGRNLKTLRPVPLKQVAEKLRLRIHERDTFTGWDVPPAEGGRINLIVAVSFGLFIPSRILRSAAYGGLNVHPSLLPQYRGPAPIEQAILQGDKFTGVTLQTMDEKSFDNGTILAQKKFGIPDPQKISFDRLMHFLKRNAASILVQGLRKHVFVPPLIDVGSYKPANLIHAHKITPATREVDWAATTPVEIDRKYRALGPQLWTDILVNSSGDKDATRRVIFRDIQVVPMPASLRMFFRGAQFTGREGRLVRRESDADVHFFVYERNGVRQNMPQMYVVADDGQAIIIAQSANQSACVRVREITVAGKPQVPAAQAMRTFKDHEAWDLSRRASGGIRSDPKTGEGLVRRQAGGGLVRREARNYPLVRRTLAPPHPRKETAPIGRYEKARLAKVPPVAASGGGGGDVESKP